MLEERLATSILDAIEQPHDLALDIIDMRNYARAKEAIDSAQRQEDVPASPYVDLVMEIYQDISDEVRAKRG